MTKIHFRPYNPNQTVLFPQRIDEDIAENDPVRMVNALVDSLNLESFRKLYKECGRSPYHPRMMLKVILYAYMNNVYSCRKIEKLLHRDIHYIWLAGYEKPDFITINRFRNRVKKEINEVFTQTVLLLSSKGFISLNVEYIDGTKIESKANKYTFVWRKTVERNRERLMKKIHVLLEHIRFSSGISSLIPSVFTICFSSTQERIYSCWFFPLSEIFSCNCWYSSSLTRNDNCFGLVLFMPLPLHIHDIK